MKGRMHLFYKVAGAFVCFAAVCAPAQNSAPRTQDSDASDSAHPDIIRLNQELQQTRSQLADSLRQIEQLRKSVDELRQQMLANQNSSNHAGDTQPATTPAFVNPAPVNEAAVTTTSGEPTVAAADQDPSFLASKISEMHQDKVESVSKYPVKISGLVLFNSYWNNGYLDIQDLPNLAFAKFPGAPNPGVGATLRQTVLGVDATGPKVWGARSSASAEVDFAGGSPGTSFGVATGLLRLRTAKVSLDWRATSVSIGQDNLFFSPLSPTSYATMLEPALSWSGNLWVWTPGIVATHRVALGSDSALMLQGGVLDPLTEEAPPQHGRVSTAGEATRTPAVAGRIALDHSKAERLPFTIGFGAYRAKQQYDLFPEVTGWTANTDIKVGFGKHLEISGEGYTGQAVGGLGGGIWTSVIFPETSEPHTSVHPLRSAGGWGQVKFMPASRFEINAAFGQDENFGDSLRFFPASFSSAGFFAMQKNRTELFNFIYKPSSVLLFAVEYRHLFTQQANAEGDSGDHLNLAAGVRF
jgi:hypothetical protein